MKQAILLLAIAAVLFALPAISVAETITAYLEGGTGSVDTWVGTLGEGWVGPWATAKTSCTVAGSVINTVPLATETNNYNYLSASMTFSAVTNAYATIGRRYTVGNGIAPDQIDQTQDYTISFLFRVDEDLATGTSTFFNGTADRYNIYQGTGSGLSKSSGDTSTWIIGAYGGTQTAGDLDTIPAGNWVCEDYAGTQTTTSYKWDTGINIAQGVTAFQVTIHPNKTYDVAMSAGAASFSKSGMGFRNDAFTNGYVQFAGKPSATSGDVRKFSIDSVVIHQVPEPSMLVLGLGVVLAALAMRRRK